MSEEVKEEGVETEETTSQENTVAETELTHDDKTWGMLAHFSGFAGVIIPFANFIAPLIIWQIKKEVSEFAANEAKEALNFQITITCYLIVALILCLVLIGILLIPIIGIGSIVLTVLAGLSANKGEAYRYPFIFRLVK